MKKIIVYTKDGCHLCDHVITELQKLNSSADFEVTIQDITANPDLFERHKNIIPVVSVNGKIVFTAESLARSKGLRSSLQEALNAN